MMKSLVILATVLSLSLFCSATTLDETCGVVNVNDVAVFNVCPLSSIYEASSEALLQIPYNYTFSLITPLVPSCSTGSQNLVYATITDNSTNECYDIAGTADPTVSALDSSDEGSGLIFTFAPESYFDNATFIVQVACDSDLSDGLTVNNATMNTSDINNYIITVYASSASACPYVSLNMLTSFMEEYKYIFVAVFVILGIFICFFGYQTLKVTIFIIATIAGVIICGLIFFHFTHLDTPKWALWVIFIVCILVGLILGYVAVRFEAVGFVALGIVLGGVGGLFLFNLVLAPFVEGKKYVLYLVCSILAVIGGIIAYKTWKKVVIIATAVIGSYLIVRAISTVIGGFPSEESIASGVAHFSGVTYAYLVVIVILAGLGAYVQWRRQKNSGESEEDQNAYERMMGGGNGNYGGNYGGGY